MFFSRGFFTPVSESDSEREQKDLNLMARPKKDEADVRRRWSVLNASRREREAIEGFAREADLSTCS
jgi:hypothetical protein